MAQTTLSSPSLIDLRSDTVTKPTDDMRKILAVAEVGDDVFSEDPTINQLQETVAALLGKDAALFVPSGTMANQLAIKAHTQPGDEIVVGAAAHNWLFESGAAAAIAGVQVAVIPGDGRFTGADLRAVYKPDNHHQSPTTLVSVENTHNMGGGLVWPNEQVADVLAAAEKLMSPTGRPLGTHLDGARLWNAAAKTGASERELAAGFDTVSVCLSKGLGAPVGSLLVGSRELIHRAHRFRKMFGGGMRQAGILAAAGLYAIENHRARLVDDHQNAMFLAKGIAQIDGCHVDLASVETNIVMVDLETGEGPSKHATATVSSPHVTGSDSPTSQNAPSGTGKPPTAHEIETKARSLGLLLVALGANRFRLVTHLDVDRAACERAVEILRQCMR